MPRKSYERYQSGFFHVWVRGSNRFNVFYAESDFIEFLKRCQSSALKNKTVITAIVLMDNHVHMQIFTNCLNRFMNSLLISFCQRYNKGWNLGGHVFQSPFSSSPIYSLDVLEGNMLYILNNPVMAGMCQSVNDYKWSSVHFLNSPMRNPISDYVFVDKSFMKFFFEDKRRLIRRCEDFITSDYQSRFRGSIFSKESIEAGHLYMPGKAGKLSINQFSNISTKSVMRGDSVDRSDSDLSLNDFGVCADTVANVGYVFDWSITNLKTRKGLINKRFVWVDKSLQKRLFAAGDDDTDKEFADAVEDSDSSLNILTSKEFDSDSDKCSNSCDRKSKKSVRVTDNEVAIFYKRLLGKKCQKELSKEEFERIVRILRFSGKATCRQIASITHQSYNYIVRLF